MKRTLILFLCFLFTAGNCFDVSADEFILAENENNVNNRGGNFTFVLDPGHGGIDGGAVGISGVLEKDLNLEVSVLLHDLLRVIGYDVAMTRQDDVLLGQGTKGQMKLEDLRARVDFAGERKDGLFVSIHMNKFPEEYCHGLTVYYSDNFFESEILGRCVRDSVIHYLQKDNNRPMKKATSALYVLHRAKVPAILVECGFLSNREEEQMLLEENYQKKLVLSIGAGLDRFVQENK